jgi:acetolactate decarboxylase
MIRDPVTCPEIPMKTPVKMFSLHVLTIGALVILTTHSVAAGPTTGPACNETGPLTVYVVRHAERDEDGSDDPGLSRAGQARAHALADTLADVGIDVVYTTQLRRTVDTAAPLVTRQQPEAHIWPVESGQAEQHVASLANILCDRHSDQTVLVVGHSNTAPQLVSALTGQPEAEISEREYDHLYQVGLKPGDSARVLRARYGEANRPGFKVAWEGALRHFHHGDVSGRVDLQHFSGRPDVIAVGPVGELDGEVTAIDGRWFITRMRDGQPVTTAETETHAGFLVWADVPAWRAPVEIDTTVSSHRELEVLIGDLAEAAALDTDTPFPFRVQAVASSLDWHVLAPPRDGQEQRGHLDSAFKQRLEQVEVELVGFFSRHHAGVFTHRDSWAHIHVILPNGHAGHVDAIELEAGARLMLPR